MFESLPAGDGRTFQLAPSDMKFLCFLNGELRDSATYFLSFANVSKAVYTTLNGKFGTCQIARGNLGHADKDWIWLTGFKVQR